jgi:hypothetical protein
MPFFRGDHNMEESAETLRAANLIPWALRAYVTFEAVCSSFIIHH